MKTELTLLQKQLLPLQERGNNIEKELREAMSQGDIFALYNPVIIIIIIIII